MGFVSSHSWSESGKSGEMMKDGASIERWFFYISLSSETCIMPCGCELNLVSQIR